MRGTCYSGIDPSQTELISFQMNNEQKERSGFSETLFYEGVIPVKLVLESSNRGTGIQKNVGAIHELPLKY